MTRIRNLDSLVYDSVHAPIQSLDDSRITIQKPDSPDIECMYNNFNLKSIQNRECFCRNCPVLNG